MHNQTPISLVRLLYWLLLKANLCKYLLHCPLNCGLVNHGGQFIEGYVTVITCCVNESKGGLVSLLENKLIKWQSNDWYINCLSKIDAKWTDQSRFVSNIVLSLGIREIISTYVTTLMYLRKNVN